MPQGILRPGKYGSSELKEPTELVEPLLPVQKSRTTDSLSSVGDDEEGDEEATESHDGVLPETMSRKDTITTVVVTLMATAGLATSASAMVAAVAAAGSALAVPSLAVFLMGGVCIANSPVVAKQHLSILKGQGKREAVNLMRKDVDILKSEINLLGRAVDDLQAEVDVLVGLEENLSEIAAQQGTNVDELVRLVNENQSNLDQMKDYLRKMFVTSLTRAVLRSDLDGDMKISLRELPLLTLRLQISLENFGISLDTRKFEDMIKEDNDISNIMKFCANLLFPEEDGGDDDSVDSELTFDFEQFCFELEDKANEKMTLEEKFSLVTVDERYSKGSLEVARGKRMTLLPSCSVRSLGARESRRRTIVKEVRKSRARATVMRATLLAGGGASGRRSRVRLSSGMVVVTGRESRVSRF